MQKFEISLNGVVLAVVNFINWIKWRADLQSYVVCEESDAMAFIIPADPETEREEIYSNIEGKSVCDPTFPTATIREINE